MWLVWNLGGEYKMRACDFVYDRVYHTAAVEFRNCPDLIIGIGRRKIENMLSLRM